MNIVEKERRLKKLDIERKRVKRWWSTGQRLKIGKLCILFCSFITNSRKFLHRGRGKQMGVFK